MEGNHRNRAILPHQEPRRPVHGQYGSSRSTQRRAHPCAGFSRPNGAELDRPSTVSGRSLLSGHCLPVSHRPIARFRRSRFSGMRKPGRLCCRASGTLRVHGRIANSPVRPGRRGQRRWHPTASEAYPQPWPTRGILRGPANPARTPTRSARGLQPRRTPRAARSEAGPSYP